MFQPKQDIILMKETTNNVLNQLYEKYGDNNYVLKRIQTYITNYLPNIIENELINFEKRKNRIRNLYNEQQIFIQIFLTTNQYFYLQSSNLYYEYNNKNYKIVSEDDIVYNLLTNISHTKILFQWKHKTKIHIMKQIKDRGLFTSIPDTETIQEVLNVLYPSIFQSKLMAKYFLIIIGDNILKKNTHLIFLINNTMKQFIQEIDDISNITIKNNISNNFLCKYHEKHLYENCRLIKLNEGFSFEMCKNVIRKIGLNLLCVATHYSNRFGDSDVFCNNMTDEDIKTYILYLKNNNQKLIIDNFCNKFIQPATASANNEASLKIEWKQLHFIWKQFIHTNYLPNIIYSNTLKTLLKEKYKYEEQTDAFHHITSKYLPIIHDFLAFWESAIIISNNTVDIQEIEIDELTAIFKYWIKQNQHICKSIGNINDDNTIKIINHFFPQIIIKNDKYILNIYSVMWNKNKDIKNSFEFIAYHFKNKNANLLSFEDAYNYYWKFASDHIYKFIVSKKYFETYLQIHIPKYIIYERFIINDWINNLHN
jgi:hypothetical protein